MQLSTKIPVFVLTRRGVDLVARYCGEDYLIKQLNLEKQYLISGKYEGRKIRMGNFDTYLKEAKMLVRSEREPRLLYEGTPLNL